MFIFKLGAEALNRLEEHLNEQSTNSSNNQKIILKNNSYSNTSNMESSILYNLLSSDESSVAKPKSLLHPIYQINIDQPMPPRANTISFSAQHRDQITDNPRPYSAPQLATENSSKIRKRKHSIISAETSEIQTMNIVKNCKIMSEKTQSETYDSSMLSCSPRSFVEEPMDLSKTTDQISSHSHNYQSDNGRVVVNSWLIDTIEMIHPNNEQYNRSLAELSVNVRLHLLQVTWHRLIVTYLYNHLLKTSSIHMEGLTKFIASLSGMSDRSVLSNKKISKMYKTQLEELNNILYQIKKLNLNEKSMDFLRIGLFLTGSHDEMNKKNLNLVELFIQSKIGISELNITIIRDIINNVLKLNSVIIEAIFYSHLDESVENVIEQLLLGPT